MFFFEKYYSKVASYCFHRSKKPSAINHLSIKIFFLSINRFYFTLRTMLGTSSVGKREEILDMVSTALGDTQLTP